MGQTLSEPITTKDSACCQNAALRVGSSCMQGWRVEMEDSMIHLLELPDDPGSAFFGVYDGHGGDSVAKYAAQHLHKYVTKRPEYLQDCIELALQKGFVDFDQELMQHGTWSEQMAGSTAVVVLIKEKRLYCANAGDSRAIACVAGVVQPLSVDHKPNNDGEHKRIIEAGGWVELNRVNGNLALSRALGDFMYKRNKSKSPKDQIVTAHPDVEARNINEEWEFVLLACDGIWDVMSSAEVCNFVRQHIAQGEPPERICEELMNNCLAHDINMVGLGGDNMSVVLVCFLHDKPYEELVKRCRSGPKATLDKVGDSSPAPAARSSMAGPTIASHSLNRLSGGLVGLPRRRGFQLPTFQPSR